MQANLTEQGFWQLCPTGCRLQFLRRWLRVHWQEAARIGKPGLRPFIALWLCQLLMVCPLPPDSYAFYSICDESYHSMLSSLFHWQSVL
jgi:hypothetical protein